MREQNGVFISHISEESPVALVLQRYLRYAFGVDFPVFVSTDETSIDAGAEWYHHIVRSVRDAAVIIVLLSQESQKRPWILFEAGVGVGTDALVIPVALSRFTLSQLAYPLAGIQGRTIDDIGHVIDAVADRTGLAKQVIDVDWYARDMREAEAKLNYRSITVKPVAMDGRVDFDIVNVGNTDVELLMLEVLVPNAILNNSAHSYLDQGPARRKGYARLAWYSPRGVYAAFPPLLCPILTPSMGEFRPRFGVPIRDSLSEAEQRLPLYFQIHAVGYTTEPEEFTLSELSARSSA